MTTDRMKPDDSPLPLGGLLASGLAAGKHGPNGHVARALDESRATLEAGPDQVGDQRLDDAPPPSPDLAEIIAAGDSPALTALSSCSPYCTGNGEITAPTMLAAK